MSLEQCEMCRSARVLHKKHFTKSDFLKYSVSVDPVNSAGFPTFCQLSDLFIFGHLHNKVSHSCV